ncbi:MAG: glycogen debranching N-terminal domain-containing protein [Mycobacterium leprae]
MNRLVSREQDLFLVSDSSGNIGVEKDHGLYARDTRHLSQLELRLNGEPLAYLTAVAGDGEGNRIYLQNNGREPRGLRRGMISALRRQVLWDGVLHEELTLTNYHREPVSFRLSLDYSADFYDQFEVRGAPRERRGHMLPPRAAKEGVRLTYLGLDEVERSTTLHFAPVPTSLASTSHGETGSAEARVTGEAVWELTLLPGGNTTLAWSIGPDEGAPVGFTAAAAALAASYAQWSAACTAVETDHDLLNRVLQRSTNDLRLLLEDRGQGPFPVAGIPWYAVPYGRDSLLTALECLPLNPTLAAGTLRTMAQLQGKMVDPRRQEQPGKIIHELRGGELAILGETPYSRYYGSADSTPLFLLLLARYAAWTGDTALVAELLPNLKAALTWLTTYGDVDGDGFIEFHADQWGLKVQSWKDSDDSMSHRTGIPAESPLAVSEVQGYVYAAKRELAPVLRSLGEASLADQLEHEAAALKERFNEAFWMADQQFPAIALDKAKAQVGTVSSDAGHCLLTGILDEAKAAAVAQRLVAPDLFSGWGIRTLSNQEASYNPMRYHNGTVWPHDNALAILGLARYGHAAEANRVIEGLLQAVAHFPLYRMPELWCGYGRDEEAVPVEYPVACSPQAWSAAAPFAFIQAMLGLEADSQAGILYLRPHLPEWLGRIRLRRLRVADSLVDLTVTRTGVESHVVGNLQVVQLTD